MKKLIWVFLLVVLCGCSQDVRMISGKTLTVYSGGKIIAQYDNVTSFMASPSGRIRFRSEDGITVRIYGDWVLTP